ncbi:MAG: hypothetical protein LT082_01780, partial [Comamonas sp.]|nr:hypothetical protein [Comamonas sp.]
FCFLLGFLGGDTAARGWAGVFGAYPAPTGMVFCSTGWLIGSIGETTHTAFSEVDTCIFRLSSFAHPLGARESSPGWAWPV